MCFLFPTPFFKNVIWLSCLFSFAACVGVATMRGRTALSTTQLIYDGLFGSYFSHKPSRLLESLVGYVVFARLPLLHFIFSFLLVEKGPQSPQLTLFRDQSRHPSHVISLHFVILHVPKRGLVALSRTADRRPIMFITANLYKRCQNAPLSRCTFLKGHSGTQCA